MKRTVRFFFLQFDHDGCIIGNDSDIIVESSVVNQMEQGCNGINKTVLIRIEMMIADAQDP